MSDMSNEIHSNIGVKKTGTACEGFSPGRCPMETQRGPGRHQTTARGRKWSQIDNRTVMECFYLSKPGKRIYRKKMHRLWMERSMFQVTEQRLVDQANQIQKKKWLSDIELEEIKRNIEDIPHGEAVNEQRVETEGMDEQEHEILGNTDISKNQDEGEVDRDERYFVGDEEGNTIQIREGQILSEEEEKTVGRMREILQEERQSLSSLRGVDRMNLKTTAQEVDKVIAKLKGNDITGTNNIIYAGAKVVIEKLGIKSGKRAKK